MPCAELFYGNANEPQPAALGDFQVPEVFSPELDLITAQPYSVSNEATQLALVISLPFLCDTTKNALTNPYIKAILDYDKLTTHIEPSKQDIAEAAEYSNPISVSSISTLLEFYTGLNSKKQQINPALSSISARKSDIAIALVGSTVIPRIILDTKQQVDADCDAPVSLNVRSLLLP
jgi:hypothetical protein